MPKRGERAAVATCGRPGLRLGVALGFKIRYPALAFLGQLYSSVDPPPLNRWAANVVRLPAKLRLLPAPPTTEGHRPSAVISPILPSEVQHPALSRGL